MPGSRWHVHAEIIQQGAVNFNDGADLSLQRHSNIWQIAHRFRWNAVHSHRLGARLKTQIYIYMIIIFLLFSSDSDDVVIDLKLVRIFAKRCGAVCMESYLFTESL